MTGLDTNVLVRYIMQDDPPQALRATKLIESLTDSNQGFVSTVCIIELVWVLTSAFELSRIQAAQAVDLLLQSKELRIENHASVLLAHRRFKETKADFADCLIERLGHQHGCSKTMTFDAAAARYCGMSLL